ncbi:glutamine--fructose-6-phosphate transaminase (isomerizing), partial [Candidatus Micrarchaeota archaeon]|nr:glutamine--fructose-6-phosphate transaminase (isomerizing) [Candidatus Micrarchaeota archaeon]
CGIIGYAGQREAAPLVLDGLKQLEYRGYDSWGIATVNNELRVEKRVGKIEGVGESELSKLLGSVGVGHSRWATHGGVTRENAHPHVDCKNEIAVVHNGIIDNYVELRNELEARGHAFKSQTDTEVIPHLIEEEIAAGAGFTEAVLKTARKLNGSFALAVLNTRDPNTLVGVRNESPLIVGLGASEFFVASDVLAFLNSTKKVVYLNDGELVTACKSPAGLDITFTDLAGNRIEKNSVEVSWDAESAEKRGYPHYMLKEIMEQPAALRNALNQDLDYVQQFAEDLKKANVIAIACGTARHSAVVGKHLFDKIAGKQIEVMIASEFAYFADNVPKDAIVLAVSQSGETADVLEGLKKAKARGARIYSIVNVVGSTIARLSDKVIYINAGPEIGVASTKAFVNQVGVFYMLAYAIAGKIEEGLQDLKHASALVEKTLNENDVRMRALAEKIKTKKDVYFIGRGVNFPIALEGALKLKEISYIHAEGMPAGELKHGTIALIEKGVPVIALNPRDYTFSDTVSNAMETKARGAFVIGVSSEKHECYDEFIQLPDVEKQSNGEPRPYYLLLEIIPLQIL